MQKLHTQTKDINKDKEIRSKNAPCGENESIGKQANNFIAMWIKEYEDEKKVKYGYAFKKAQGIVMNLIKQIGIRDLLERAKLYWESDDKYKASARTIVQFNANINYFVPDSATQKFKPFVGTPDEY